MEMTDKDLQFYKDFDFERSNQIKHPLIEKLQARKRLAEQLEKYGFDEDVIYWLVTQDDDNKRHINDMIRHAMALQGYNGNKNKSPVISKQPIEPIVDSEQQDFDKSVFG